jgi:plastocyanin
MLRPGLACALVVSTVLVGSVSHAQAATVRGKVSIVERGGRPADPSGAVVWLDRLPPGAAASATAGPGRHVVETRDKQFRPRVLPVVAGSTVAFPNSDPILHNVFSVSPGNAFDLGLYGPGGGKEVVLRAPGVVRAYCNVHAHMVAFLVVAPTGHFARVRPDGTFSIEGAPAGTYDVVVWDERGGTATRPVTVAAGGTAEVALELDARGFRSRPHLDKTGRPYRDRPAEDPYR